MFVLFYVRIGVWHRYGFVHTPRCLLVVDFIFWGWGFVLVMLGITLGWDGYACQRIHARAGFFFWETWKLSQLSTAGYWGCRQPAIFPGRSEIFKFLFGVCRRPVDRPVDSRFCLLSTALSTAVCAVCFLFAFSYVGSFEIFCFHEVFVDFWGFPFSSKGGDAFGWICVDEIGLGFEVLLINSLPLPSPLSSLIFSFLLRFLGDFGLGLEQGLWKGLGHRSLFFFLALAKASLWLRCCFPLYVLDVLCLALEFIF